MLRMYFTVFLTQTSFIFLITPARNYYLSLLIKTAFGKDK